MIRAVTFDAAGTLFTPAEPVGVTYARTAARFGITADAHEIQGAFRRAVADAPPLAFPGTPAEEIGARERAWWRAVVRASLGAVEDRAFDACFDALFAHYATAGAWRVYADVPPALAAVRGRGLGTAVVSNFDGRLPSLVRELGLSPAIDCVVWSTRVGAAKPAAAIFEAAAAGLGTSLGEICHVGDDPRADVAGARAAGALAVHLDRSGATPGSLSTLEQLLARLETDQP